MKSQAYDYTEGDFRQDRDEKLYEEAISRFLKDRLQDETEELLEDEVIHERLLKIYEDDLEQLYVDTINHDPMKP